MRKGLYKLSRLIFFLLLKILTRLEIRGRENILKVKGAIYAVNHASYIDPAIAGAAVKRPIYFLARKTLFNNKIFNWWGTRVNAVPFNREAPDTAGLKNIISLLKNGEIVLLFPEGTRTSDGKLQHPHLGIGLIAVKAAVPVIPAYIKGSFDVLPRHGKFIKLKKAKITIGNPIYLDKWLNKPQTERSDYEEIAEFVMEKIKKLSELR